MALEPGPSGTIPSGTRQSLEKEIFKCIDISAHSTHVHMHSGERKKNHKDLNACSHLS